MRRSLPAALAVVLLAGAAGAGAQSLTAPPSGDNQKSTVTQQIGAVTVSISYSSPNVHAPDGSDRRGKVWGALVPWGYANLGFGNCGEKCPWRAGANENTLFTVSEDVRIEGQPLAAGSYGLHMLPGEAEWTVIFSKNSTSWGSFFYDQAEDALRVTVKPAKSDYHEWLSYEFDDRQGDRATIALKWEELAVPFTVSVPNADELWYASMARQLRSSPGFDWQSWMTASQFLVGKKLHLDVAERWAQAAVDAQFVGQENFQTLANLASAQEALGKSAIAAATRKRAWNHPAASIFELHAEGRRLLTAGQKEEAMAVFELNAKRHPNAWPVDVGLMRGYAAMGDAKKALKHARLGLEKAPDDLNKNNLETFVERLEKGDTAIN